MTDYLGEIVRGEIPPGRYRLGSPVSVRALRDELVAVGWTMRIVDGAAMHDRTSMFDEFAAGCEFPDWFGANWDAFADCLGDLSWLPDAGSVVLWQHSGAFQAADPRTWREAGRVIDAAIGSRVEAGLDPLFVLYPAVADAVSDDGGSRLQRVR